VALALSGWSFAPAASNAAQQARRLIHAAVPATVRLWRIPYVAHAGQLRRAFVLLPAWYNRRRDPALPLVISAHGRGIQARTDCRSWGDLPALGRFAVVCPEGQGAHLRLYSWGWRGQIDDLARMPAIVRYELPWLRIRRHGVYAIGGSMGGQEALLLVARFPRLLSGAVAFDAVADLGRQFRDFPTLRCDTACLKTSGGPLGRELQRFATREVGGTPRSDPRGYADRSPLSYARRIAFSGVPLELWWSTSDLVVPHQQRWQTGALFAAIRRRNPQAPVEAFVGAWIHSREQRSTARLPFALAQLGLLPRRYLRRTDRLQEHHFIPRRLFASEREPPAARRPGEPGCRPAAVAFRLQ
jgi:pimeloyl-ACP methyl ester carboxylesterase